MLDILTIVLMLVILGDGILSGLLYRYHRERIKLLEEQNDLLKELLQGTS